MSKVVVNVHRFSIAPELIPGSRWQPYDPEVDRPNTTTEGAHLAQYYSNAWLAACKAGEQLQLQAEEEIQGLEQKVQQLEMQFAQEIQGLELQVAKVSEERARLSVRLDQEKKNVSSLLDKSGARDLKTIAVFGLIGFGLLGLVGYLVGMAIGQAPG